LATPKTPIQFFFGATDQDTAQKGVKPGNLISATNLQQLHAGEFIKRGGFAQTAQTFSDENGAITITDAESLVCPDGVNPIIRDNTTDGVFSRGASSSVNISKGASRRIFATPSIRFPSLANGEQAAPMAKQAGNYFVWLHDEGHFRIARKSTDSEALIEITDPIDVNGGFGDTPSTHVKSFAILDSTAFDADALWIFWVDWTTGTTYRDSIWAYRVPHADINTHTAFRIGAGTNSNKCHTSISVGMSGSGRCTICICGNEPQGGTSIAFRSSSAGSVYSYSDFTQISYNTGSITTITSGASTQSAPNHVWASGGCCMLTIDNVAEYYTGYFYFAHWGGSVSSAYAADLILAQVNETTQAITTFVVTTVTEPNFIVGSHSMQMWTGQVTGRETGGGNVQLVVSHRLYYLDTATFVEPNQSLIENYLDTVYTEAFDWYASSSTGASKWKKQGAWLAHGWFTGPDGTDYVITGWHDPDEVQMPYHLRRFDTGAIICQFAFGQAACMGGTSRTSEQIQLACSDINSPMLQSAPLVTASAQVLLPLLAANVVGSTDVASIVLGQPDTQSPAAFRGMAVIPGPIPAIASGWQQLREMGPLVWPSQCWFAWGVGSS
jgi:hypothetical protein